MLAIPFIGAAFSEEVAWSIADFVLAGVLLVIIGVCFEAAVRRHGNVVIGGRWPSSGLSPPASERSTTRLDWCSSGRF